jgi:glycine cleavage system H protein
MGGFLMEIAVRDKTCRSSDRVYNRLSRITNQELSMSTPTDRVYAESHEWHKVDGDVVTIGLTTYAVDQLTDVTFVEMQEAGSEVDSGDSVGEVESVKTTSDIYTAATGEIIEVNDALDDNPEMVNNDPYGDGWLVKIKIADRGTLDSCMDAEAYDASL